MMNTKLDHIVIGASTLKQGVDYLENLLDVEIPQGGEHPSMGTHNHLMQLGNETFLEVIAINPDGPAPQRPRWYGLDDPFVREKLKQTPQLLTWVVNTDDICALQSQTDFPFGKATPVSRGPLNWHFALPEDGNLLAGGMLPYLIQWHTTSHPAKHMADTGCRLCKLEIYHPYPDWLTSILSSIGANALLEVYPCTPNTVPYLQVHLETPTGIKLLRTL